MQEIDSSIERRIVIGLIVSDDYIARMNKIFDIEYLQSSEAKTISMWCFDYYNKYGISPKADIEPIFYEKLANNKIQKDIAEEFEEDILPGLSDEYGRSELFNSSYLFDQTVKYFKARQLQLHTEQIQDLTERGEYEEAEQLASSYKPTILDEMSLGLELSSDEALERVERAFDNEAQQLVRFPGPLGEMMNDHLVRGGLVGFLAPEKRGKTWALLELAMRGVRQKCNIAFFQAGDMTESQQLKRLCIYLCKKSDKEKYCTAGYIPVGDCLYNQIDECDRDDRNCDHGIFEGDFDNIDDLRKAVNFKMLKEKVDESKEYEPCDSYTCNKRKGTVWLKKEPEKQPLNAAQAKEAVKNFFTKYKRKFKLATHPSDTLTVDEIKQILDGWEKQDNFVPDVVIIDYADLLTASVRDFRHKQDHIWKNLRSLSQERHCLVLTATQADANSYKSGRLGLSNFSEDKRKYAHVTAMYGLNQDPNGVEKQLGIMRINELVVREGEFSNTNEVKVLQNLRAGRPFLESYK